MESGGARLEETLLRLNCRYQTLFFCAAMTVVGAGVIGFLTSLAAFELASLIVSAFLVVFGFLLMLLDVPGSPRWAGRYRSLVRKHFRFLTRLTGKSLFVVFLGSLLSLTLWPSKRGGSGLVFLSVTMSFFVVGVALVGLLIAIRKSLRLEKVRKSVLLAAKGHFGDAYRKYAMTDPAHGLQFEEFNRLCADHTAGRLQFDITDLGIIYNALDEHQKSAINEREFSEWMAAAAGLTSTSSNSSSSSSSSSGARLTRGAATVGNTNSSSSSSTMSFSFSWSCGLPSAAAAVSSPWESPSAAAQATPIQNDVFWGLVR
ncbi:hypothetical protein Emed_005455 [Eimeria media]